MTKEEMVHLLRTDVDAWNRWKSDLVSAQVPAGGLDLTRADLSHAHLAGVNLGKVNLQHAVLDYAQLPKATLTNADLTFASLVGAVLINADFVYCILSGADMRGALCAEADFGLAFLTATNLRTAGLQGAFFDKTVLTGTDFSGATMGRTLFADSDLRQVKGLEQVVHHGPSTIGLDTIYRSEGKIPESFLRDAGVPEGFITQMHSLIGAQEGIQFYSCFISFSFHDQEFADRLHGRLRDAKLRIWYAPEDMQGGKKTHEQIETAIRIYDKLLFVLSEASLQSEWVKTEIRKARRQERKTGKRKLFPVRLVDFEAIREWECFDADAGKDSGVELREYYIPDFSTWKEHDKFEAEFKKLLRDLKADGPPPAPAL